MWSQINTSTPNAISCSTKQQSSYHNFVHEKFRVGDLTTRNVKNVNAYLEDVVVEELLHYLLVLQLSLEEENQQQFLTSDEGGLPHQLLVASGLEPLCSEM